MAISVQMFEMGVESWPNPIRKRLLPLKIDRSQHAHIDILAESLVIPPARSGEITSFQVARKQPKRPVAQVIIKYRLPFSRNVAHLSIRKAKIRLMIGAAMAIPALEAHADVAWLCLPETEAFEQAIQAALAGQGLPPPVRSSAASVISAASSSRQWVSADTTKARTPLILGYVGMTY